MTAPQRFLVNSRNLIATATLTPSAVSPVANAVIETLLARSGSAQLAFSGSYTGLADATYDVEIVDGDVDTKLVSAPVFAGAGSETLASIAVTTAAAQDFKVECHTAGQAAVSASVEIEGVDVTARASGAAGNGIHINVDVSGLTFSATSFSLIEDVTKGQGGDGSPFDGPQYDWDTATVGSDNLVPDSAHRIAFDGDRSNIYVQYKKFSDGGWKYYTVPELQNDYPAGTRILNVSGTYTVTISDADSPTTTDTLPGIVTVYDFLNAVKTTSLLCDVAGVIANDRSPTGQATREFSLRTQARALLSTGEGSKKATGFTAITVDPDANTELVTAECIAIDSKLDPNAWVGHEAWKLKGSVSGDLGTIYTGEPFANDTFGLTIPVKLPETSGSNAGRFSMTDFARGSSDAPEVEVCFSGKLGPNATDQTITLTLTARPPQNCNCEDMPVPELDTRCLGGAGSDTAMGYSTDAQTRIDNLYDWVSDLADKVTRYRQGYGDDGIPDGSLNMSPTDITASTSSTSGAQTGTLSVSGTGLGPAVSFAYNASIETTGYADVGLPASFTTLIDQFDSTLQSIDAVTDGTLLAAGFSAWDDAVTAMQGDLNDSELATLGHRLATVASLKYQIMLRRSLAAAGISPVGKSDASSQGSGDGCWQDFGDALFWKVVGTDGEYAPAFTNHPYWSSRKHEDGLYYSTKEFGLIINVKCPQNLVVGDTITLTIGNTAALGTYQVGDVLKLPLVAAADQFLTGGIDANKIQKWYVTGSVAGALEVYTFDPDSPSAYSDSGVAFLLVMGGVAPAAGDTFTFAVIGAHYHWRKNGGAWSSPIAVTSGAVALDAGLSLTFTPGASPSFVADDRWTFRALQPWGAENAKTPARARFYAGAADFTLEALFDDVAPIDSIAVALHTLPEGATLQVVGGNTVGVTDWTEALTWSAGPVVKFVEREALWVRLEVTDADGGAVGYFFAGTAIATELSADVSLQRSYRLERGNSGGLYQGGAFLGKAVSATVQWSEGALTEADATALASLLDWTKSNDDQPLIFVPQATRPQDALLAQIVDDEVELDDVWDYNPDANHQRRLSAKLGLAGVWT